MRGAREWFAALDADWRAVLVGLLGAPTLVLLGLIVGLAAGSVLPWDCQGLACIYTAAVLIYAGIVVVVWAVVSGIVVLARRRWPRSTVRTAILRVLAGLSYAPAVVLAVMAIGEAR